MLEIAYSPTNKAYLVLWYSQVLAIFSEKWEAVEYLKYLRGDTQNA